MTTRFALLSRLVLAAGLPLAGCASSDPPPATSVPPPTSEPTSRRPPTALTATAGPAPESTCPPGQSYQVGLTPTGPAGACIPIGAVPGRPLRIACEPRVAAVTMARGWG